jgi:glucose-1-phosphate thymidylyltransferase
LVIHVRKFLQEICRQDLSHVTLLEDDLPTAGDEPSLLLNARLMPSVATLKTVTQLLRADESKSGIVWDGEQVAAVVRPSWSWEFVRSHTTGGIESLLLAGHELPSLDCPLKLLSFPHDVIAGNMSSIRASLEHRIAAGGYTQKQDGVFVADGAALGEYVITDTSEGQIVIDEGATVGPYTLLRGPIYIGRQARILEHAAIKDEVSLGHTTKIGGEVEAAVVEPFTNKQHHGFLGHSYLGSWINLGAGTCNSDLKNTYGSVNMEYPAGKSATGMQFLGCVMGDYSKTAINTGIFTGKVIGVCSMMYGFVTSNVPSYVNYARLFGQMATLPPEVMIATQQRMFARRKVEQRPCDMQLLHDMYRLTQNERDRFGDEISF